MRGATRRAITSAPPPAGEDTIIVMVRPLAMVALHAGAASDAAAKARKRRRSMLSWTLLRAQSTLAPESFTTFAQRTSSVWIRPENASDERK